MKKRKLLFLPVFLILLVLAGLFFFHGFDGLIFSRACSRFSRQSLSGDALSLHFTLADPQKVGIRIESPSLPVYSRQSSRDAALAVQTLYDTLSGLDPDRLSDDRRYTLDLLLYSLKQEIRGGEFPYYAEPLSPSSGQHTELPLLLAEYTFRSEQDVETYLALLETFPDWAQGLAAYEREKAAAGLFMTDEDATNVISQCGQILDQDSLLAGEHFLQTTFRSRLEQLLDKGILSKDRAQTFLDENDRLLTTVALPAYQSLCDELTLLIGQGQYGGGLYEKPDGRAYYAWLVGKNTGSSREPDEIFLLLQNTFQKKYEELQTLAFRYQELTGNPPDLSLLSDGFPLTDPSEILTDLQTRMQEDFPSLSLLLGKEPVQCTVKDVDPALESLTSPAFYMTPPVDDPVHNTICINRSSTSEGLSLYTTLAHEGYPGHLYQTVYFSLHSASGKGLPVRELLYFGGYVEGWAYYTEQLSFSYAAQLLENAPSPYAASVLCSLASLQRDLQINLFCLLDFSLHYYGASREEILTSLSSFGFSADAALRIYNYLRTEPAVYLKYYVGYLEMTALRDRARTLWGEDFSLQRFHRFVLEVGPSDFSSLAERLQDS